VEIYHQEQGGEPVDGKLLRRNIRGRGSLGKQNKWILQKFGLHDPISLEGETGMRDLIGYLNQFSRILAAAG
jgi:hypothetical protein